MPAKPIPEGYEGVTPYLSIRGAAEAIDFYKRAFGAVELMRMPQSDGRLGHAEIAIGKAKIMLADEFPEIGFRSPLTIGGTPVVLHIYIDDVDAMVKRAEAAGSSIDRPPSNEFYGDRIAQLTDPYSHRWSFATRIEDVTPGEMQRRNVKLG